MVFSPQVLWLQGNSEVPLQLSLGHCVPRTQGCKPAAWVSFVWSENVEPAL